MGPSRSHLAFFFSFLRMVSFFVSDLQEDNWKIFFYSTCSFFPHWKIFSDIKFLVQFFDCKFFQIENYFYSLFFLQLNLYWLSRHVSWSYSFWLFNIMSIFLNVEKQYRYFWLWTYQFFCHNLFVWWNLNSKKFQFTWWNSNYSNSLYLFGGIWIQTNFSLLGGIRIQKSCNLLGRIRIFKNSLNF